jgi:hypothetical protein
MLCFLQSTSGLPYAFFLELSLCFSIHKMHFRARFLQGQIVGGGGFISFHKEGYDDDNSDMLRLISKELFF